MFGLHTYHSITKEDDQEEVHKKLDTPAKKSDEPSEKTIERTEDTEIMVVFSYAATKNISVEQAKKELAEAVLAQRHTKLKKIASDKENTDISPEKNTPGVEGPFKAPFLDDGAVNTESLHILDILFESADFMLGELYILKFLKVLRFIFIIATGYGLLPKNVLTVFPSAKNTENGFEFFGFEIESLFNIAQISGQILFIGIFASLLRKYIAALKMPAENVVEKYKALQQTLPPLENVVDIITVGIPSAFTLAYFVKYAFTENFSFYISSALTF